jgi:hypothetical protein
MVYDDPQSFVDELFAHIDRELGSGGEAVQEWIEGQLHGAAVSLLHAMLPAMVRANNVLVKGSGSADIGASRVAVQLSLAAADVGNDVLAGAVAHKVTEGLDRLRADNDYLRGVNSIG